NLVSLDSIPSLSSLEAFTNLQLKKIEEYEREDNGQNKDYFQQWKDLLELGREHGKESRLQLRQLGDQCEMLSTVEYDFLYDKTTCLLRIGYNVEEQRKDDSFYDLLASEARLGIFAAIAQGKLPQESWFALGRLLI